MLAPHATGLQNRPLAMLGEKRLDGDSTTRLITITGWKTMLKYNSGSDTQTAFSDRLAPYFHPLSSNSVLHIHQRTHAHTQLV